MDAMNELRASDSPSVVGSLRTSPICCPACGIIRLRTADCTGDRRGTGRSSRLRPLHHPRSPAVRSPGTVRRMGTRLRSSGGRPRATRRRKRLAHPPSTQSRTARRTSFLSSPDTDSPTRPASMSSRSDTPIAARRTSGTASPGASGWRESPRRRAPTPRPGHRP